MSDYIDLNYINNLSSRLLKFKRVSNTAYSFRCPLCGDSQKNKNKARGYIYEHGGYYSFKCHNCGESMTFPKFLETIDPGLYAEYRMDKYRNNHDEDRVEIVHAAPIYDTKIFETLVSVKDQENCLYRQYVLDRKIPIEHLDKLFYTHEFKKFVNCIIPGKFDESMDEPRLVIPFFDEHKKLIAFTGRSYKAKSKLRYIKITLKGEEQKTIYGLDRWDKNKETFVVEGPLDSLFLTNCIATAGGDLMSAIRDYDKEKFVIVYDNEPWSKTTRDKINKSIDHGYKVCIWPNNVKEKDINAMILAGRNSLDIENLIRYNSFLGLKAQIKLTFWK